MQIRFGQFKGTEVNQLPSYYLEWLLRMAWVWPDLKYEARQELRYRAVEEDCRRREWEREQAEARQRQARRAARIQPDPALATEIIARGYKLLVSRCHPDVGGDHESMVRLTHTKDWLLATLQAALPGASR